MTITPLPNSIFISFLFGAVLMTVGIGLFTLGVDKSMTPMGEYVGTTMTKSKKIWLICLISFLVGAMITVSEPDLQVLAGYVPSIDTYTFIISVAVGVGVFLVIAILRIILAVKVRYILIVSYAAIFVLAAFVDPDFGRSPSTPAVSRQARFPYRSSWRWASVFPPSPPTRMAQTTASD